LRSQRTEPVNRPSVTWTTTLSIVAAVRFESVRFGERATSTRRPAEAADATTAAAVAQARRTRRVRRDPIAAQQE
jgi:hypothetical protein